MKGFACPLGGALLLAALAGCTAAPQPLGEVDGVVLLDGKPLPEVTVIFLPEAPDKYTTVRRSSALTDEQGRYKLRYEGEPDRNGAVLARHHVIVEDTRSENTQGKEPSRVPARYTKANKSPLHFQVKAGQQTIELKLESDKPEEKQEEKKPDKREDRKAPATDKKPGS